MLLLFLALVTLTASGLLALAAARRGSGEFSARVGATGAVCGAGLAVAAAVMAMPDGHSWQAWTLWQSPIGPFHAGIDRLSAIFIILISVIGALAAVYGRGYLSGHGDAGHDGDDSPAARRGGRSWCWFNLLLASMLLVVTARDGMTFLFAWEAMSLASFFLVMFDHETPGVTRSGWIYLVTTHVGAAFLFFMFMYMGGGGDLDFTSIAASGRLAPGSVAVTVVFLAALIGFGTKAGLVPTHIWLPEAHPAAPSHVSAVMSGVMIKTGIYGLLRIISMLGHPPAWWGWTVVILGAVSGICGVLFALAQHDLKRLLAYHSIENIGIIMLGIGVGLLGASFDQPLVSTLGFAGAILHTVNHAVFKNLLFIGAGSVYHATGLRDVDRLGGLMKRMPVTGTTFTIGAAAISGLPPLNGFVSEFLIFCGAVWMIIPGTAVWAAVVTMIALALIGGLALACFTKASGAVFLGEPRCPEAARAHESPSSMRIPMIILAAACVLLGLGAPWIFEGLLPVVEVVNPSTSTSGAPLPLLDQVFGMTTAVGLLAAAVGVMVLIRRLLLGRRQEFAAPTWDCGYAAASPRVQYTASSFADPLLRMFRMVLRTKRHVHEPEGLFPPSASLQTHTADVFMSGAYEPAARGIERAAGLGQRLQGGSTHLYLVYIFLTIIALMIWNLR